MLSTSRLTSKPYYRPELDALRFAAFFFVFLSHALPPWWAFQGTSAPWFLVRGIDTVRQAGARGVDVFFLLSAYLITDILLREWERTKTINLGAFWMRRILRIWPLYYTFLLFAIVVVPHLLPQSLPGIQVFAFATFWGNFAGMTPRGIRSVTAILWSVSVEEQFYLVWPLIVRFQRRRLVAICLGLIVASTVLRLALLVHGVVSFRSIWENTFTRLEPIAVGALIAVACRDALPQWSRRTRAICLGLGLVLLWTTGVWPSSVDLYAVVSYLLATGAAALLLVGVLGAHWRLPAWLLYLGRISYGLYVFHLFCLQFVRQTLGSAHPWAWVYDTPIALGFTIALAAISYRWLERPFLKLKDQFSREASFEQRFKNPGAEVLST